ncbi:hypothetical protein NPIL_171351, partial [Nephila pilipes]
MRSTIRPIRLCQKGALIFGFPND